MFDINSIFKNLQDKFPPKVINKAIQGLVNKGVLEQYTEEDGSFSFQLTDFGVECAEEIFANPTTLLDFDDLDDPDEVDEDGTF